jgi:hypothetical protein
LADAFVQRLLQKILIAAKELAPPLSPVHLDSWDLGRLEVRREWQNIDIVLVDPINHLVVVIENKIGSTEHSGQLARYLRNVGTEYPAPTWRHLAIYLTPDGASPSVTDYLPADYGLVADTVEAVAESRRVVLDPAVHALMVHYARMLRRHIVADSEIADLCRRIYHRHQRALDLIFEHRQGRLAEVRAPSRPVSRGADCPPRSREIPERADPGRLDETHGPVRACVLGRLSEGPGMDTVGSADPFSVRHCP